MKGTRADGHFPAISGRKHRTPLRPVVQHLDQYSIVAGTVRQGVSPRVLGNGCIRFGKLDVNPHHRGKMTRPRPECAERAAAAVLAGGRLRFPRGDFPNDARNLSPENLNKRARNGIGRSPTPGAGRHPARPSACSRRGPGAEGCGILRRPGVRRRVPQVFEEPGFTYIAGVSHAVRSKGGADRAPPDDHRNHRGNELAARELKRRLGSGQAPAAAQRSKDR